MKPTATLLLRPMETLIFGDYKFHNPTDWVMYVKLYPQPEEPKPSTDAHDYEWIDATGEGAGE